VIALHGTAAHVERAVRQFRRAKRNESLDTENERHERRRVVWRLDDDGSFLLYGRFSPEQGERIMKAVDAAMDEIDAEKPGHTLFEAFRKPVPFKFPPRNTCQHRLNEPTIASWCQTTRHLSGSSEIRTGQFPEQAGEFVNPLRNSLR